MAKKEETKKEKFVKMGLQPYEEQPVAVYSNLLIVNHAEHDFTLTFAHITIPPEAGEAPQDRSFTIPVVARVTIPRTQMRSTIMALQKNLERYEEHYGPIEEIREGSK